MKHSHMIWDLSLHIEVEKKPLKNGPCNSSKICHDANPSIKYWSGISLAMTHKLKRGERRGREAPSSGLLKDWTYMLISLWTLFIFPFLRIIAPFYCSEHYAHNDTWRNSILPLTMMINCRKGKHPLLYSLQPAEQNIQNVPLLLLLLLD